MLDLIKKLFSTLKPEHKKQLLYLQLLVVTSALFEVATLMLVGTFVSFIADPTTTSPNIVLKTIFSLFNFKDQNLSIIYFGSSILFALVMSAVLSVVAVWRLGRLSNKIGFELGECLLNYYLHQTWTFHIDNHSSYLTKQIAEETARVRASILNPLLQAVSKIVLCLTIITGLLIYQPILAICLTIIFTISYLSIYKLVRGRLLNNGRYISELSATRYKLIAEALGSVKDIQVLGRQKNIVSRFNHNGERLAHFHGINHAISSAPKSLMELVVYGITISIVLLLFNQHDGNIVELIPTLSIYALAAAKLLPSFQQIYNCFSVVSANLAALECILDDLVKGRKYEISFNKANEIDDDNVIRVRSNICLANISFKYPNKDDYALKNINLEIKANHTVGIVGLSGSGKSTLMDILLGLFTPNQGKLIVDNHTITKKNLTCWQKSIGFVPQQIYLSDLSIKQNIAFGLPDEEIDIDKIRRSILLSQLDELVHDLEHGIETIIGEGGIQLSGGQRQRIGIARALYNDPDILIFDEATSALDNITEEMIMESIHKLAGKKTIFIIAHRLSTVEDCNTIIVLDKGRLVDNGTYQQLSKTSHHFKKLIKK